MSGTLEIWPMLVSGRTVPGMKHEPKRDLANVGLIVLVAAVVYLVGRAGWNASRGWSIGCYVILGAIAAWLLLWHGEETGKAVGSLWRGWDAVDIGIRYLAVGGLVAASAFLNVWIHVKGRREAEAYTQWLIEDNKRKAATHQALLASQAAERRRAEEEQALIVKVFKPWSDLSAKPLEQQTPARIADAERQANNIAALDPRTNTDDMRRRNADEKTKRVKAYEYRTMAPAERAALALELLKDGSTRELLCGARAELSNAQPKDANNPALKSAAAKIRIKETALLRAEWQAEADGRILLCRDGSTSSCRCNGSRRGCCSHHGGVASCESMPVMAKGIECGK